jgi:DNA topoisomerase IA
MSEGNVVIFILCGIISALGMYVVHLRSTLKRNKAVMESMLDVIMNGSPKKLAQMTKFINDLKDEVEKENA